MLCNFLLVGLLPYVLWAQSEEGRRFVRYFAPNEYEAHTQNWDFAEDARGLLYAGNNSGVLEYDGQEWRLIPAPNGTVVRSLMRGGDGLIYAGAQGELGFLKADGPERRTVFQSLLPQIPEEYRQFSNVWQVANMPEGIYFRTDQYLFRWAGGQMRTWVAPSAFNRSFVVNQQYYILDDSLGLLRLQEEELRPAPGGAAFARTRFYAMLPHHDGKIVLGLRTGLLLYDPITGTAQPFASPFNAFLKDNPLYNGIRLSSGSMLFTTLGGGAFVVGTDGAIQGRLHKDNGLPDDVVINAYEDQQRGIWLGLNNGIARAEWHSPFQFWDETLGMPPGLNAVIRYKGELYAATDVGVYRLRNGRFEALSALANIQAWELLIYRYPGGQEALLIATTDGIFETNGTLMRAISTSSAFQFSLYAPLPDRVLVASGQGVLEMSYREGRLQVNSTLPGTAGTEFRSIAEAPDGSVWAVSLFNGPYQFGLYPDGAWELRRQYQQVEGLRSLKDFYVFHLRDEVLFGTTAGLYRYDAELDSIRPEDRFGPEFTRYQRDVYRLAQDQQGRLWITGANPVTGRPGWLEMVEGKPKWEGGVFRRLPRQPIQHIWPDPSDGTIWVSGAEALYRYNPAVPLPPNGQSAALIRKVVQGADSLLFAGGSGPQPSVHLPYDRNGLTFYAAMPAFDGAAPLQYSFWLEGYDEGWSAWSADPKKEYTNLPESSDYRLHVKARDAYGRESQQGIFSFSVAPPFYRTTWAYISYVLVLLGIIWGSTRLYTRRIRREKEVLERLVRKRTMQIEEQKNSILEKNVELEQQNEQIAAQHNLLERQHHEISKQNEQIAASINYAQRIQVAMMPSAAELAEVLPNSFVMLQPRDVVSGDFYWMARRDDYILLAAADCTGHGVPGALMSMMGQALLQQLVIQEAMTDPGQILTRLHHGIRRSLKQDQTENRDGMDIALCAIDRMTKEVFFAGAKNPIFYVQNGQGTLIKGDTFPIGGWHRDLERIFTTHQISVESPTYCYLFSDGFQDQFGGPKREKFLSRRLRELLVSLSPLPPEKQQQELQTTLRNWIAQGGERQLDDVLVLGFRLE